MPRAELLYSAGGENHAPAANLAKVIGFLSNFGEAERMVIQTGSIEKFSLRNGEVFPLRLCTEKRHAVSKLPRFTKMGQEP
jgi:hypothetical protein